MGQNLEIVRDVYKAFDLGDISAVLATFDKGIVWNEAENMNYADHNPYIGPHAVLAGVFARIPLDVCDFSVNAATFIDAGETIVVEGRYQGKWIRTGKMVDAQFAHVWEFKDGLAVRFQQYTDTLQWALAANR